MFDREAKRGRWAMIDLGGKTVLVTGASRGIGRACAETLGRAGAHVVPHYARDRAVAEKTAKTLPGGRAHPVRADLAAPGAGARLWRDALNWRGRLDVLVNNAGVYEAAASSSTSPTSSPSSFLAWRRTPPAPPSTSPAPATCADDGRAGPARVSSPCGAPEVIA